MPSTASVSGSGLLPGLREIEDVGRGGSRTGGGARGGSLGGSRAGYHRHLFDDAELDLRAWFIERATAAGLAVETDRNANIWAWWGVPGPDAVVTGSHLDSVPGGGAYDGPLGVVSALDAVAALRAAGFAPSRPFAVVVFAEEEGSRFGVACLGSRLMTGQLNPERARALLDPDGVSLAEAGSRAGFDVANLGHDPEALARIGLFIELHVEQGRGLIDLGAPVAVASSILAHGRWRLTFTGQANHAGATLMHGRRDPVVAASRAIVGLRDIAASHAAQDARTTVGRSNWAPGGTNVIAAEASVWLDARAATDADTRALVAEIVEASRASAALEGCELDVAEESWSGAVRFDVGLRERFAAALGDVPRLSTGAGHDAGVLAGVVPTAMLFVRNPTGISHAPEEFAEHADTLAGVEALTSILRSLL
ncbi:allantoate amidohydrolase [Subtercola endophyticus]|uniref:allantoate amidohydrolase n=1 Tax=Subtercola endophyticus TaxID=2895559 RepID=UPI001E55ACE8|nr:allantoate amidohydrolase [Subtercola endophyticus]UFS59423.1 allantoate amidohydrolase [Subtercola endophyticus]